MSIGLPRELPLETLSHRLEKVALTAAELAQARQDVNTEPTEAQQRAGNYAKGHVSWNGLEIAIENPKGSTRSGKDKSGKPWSQVMAHDYGYIKGTVGRDKDHVDVFIGPHLDSELIFIVNQTDPSTGTFDEWKVMLGFMNEEQARTGYLANYEDGWQGLGSIVPMTLPTFRKRIHAGKTKAAVPEKTGAAREAWPAGVPGVATDEGSLPHQHQQAIQALRGPWDQGLPEMANELPGLSRRHGSKAAGDDAGEEGQRQGLLPRELHVGDQTSAASQQEEQPVLRVQRGKAGDGRLGQEARYEEGDAADETGDAGMDTGKGVHGSSGPVSENRGSGQAIKVPLPHVRQSRNYTCGDAALEAINDELGTQAKGELEIAEDAGATPEGGTTPENLAEEARRLGLSAEARDDMTVETLKECLDADRAVIVAIQAWGDPANYDKLEEGHYVVAIGYDDTNFYFMDPSVEGEYGELTHEEFEQRWKDQDATGKVRNHLGIVIWQPGKQIPDEPVDATEKISVDIPKLGDPLKLIDSRKNFNERMERMANLLWKIRKAQMRWRKARKGRRKKAEVAPGMGIPDPRNFGDLSRMQPGDLMDLVIQHHLAQRAGPHYDVRIGNPELGLYSWASRKGLPEPQHRAAAFRTPVHAHQYGDFQGTLSGYGAGTVRRQRKGQVLITGISPNKVEFTTADERHPQRYVLLKPRGFKGKDWLLMNTTPSKAVPYQKLHMITIPKEKVEPILDSLKEGDAVQPKIDGAASLIKLLKDGVEVMSYRVSDQTGRPIIHTERIFGNRPKMAIPPELVGTILKGEIYGMQNVPSPDGRPDDSVGVQAPGAEQAAARPAGTDLDVEHGQPGVGEPQARPFGTRSVIGPQELGGLLNAGIAESIRKQRERDIRLRVMLHNVQQVGRHPVSPYQVPYSERQQLLQSVLQHLPADTFHIAESADTPEKAKALWADIVAGKHPLSREGVVIHPALGKPRKAKLFEEQDVHITNIFPGAGKYQDLGAGGFEYSLTPGGPTVGRVGSGFTDEMRRDLYANPGAYVGRVARVKSQGPFGSGALRAPSLIALHEDYPSKLASDLEDLGIIKQADDEESEKVPTVAVDLDGTLAEQMEPFDPNKIGKPRPGAKKWLQAFRDAGARIVIFTVRGKTKMVEAWLDEHQMPYDFVNENPDQPADSSGKVIADVYWDDRAVSAAGRLSSSGPDVLERLKAADDGPTLIYSNPEDILEIINLMKEAA